MGVVQIREEVREGKLGNNGLSVLYCNYSRYEDYT